MLEREGDVHVGVCAHMDVRAHMDVPSCGCFGVAGV